MDKITKKNALSKVDQDTIETVKKIKEYKQACEANIVSILWKDPDLFYSYDNLGLDDFTYNEWKVFWTIGNEIVTEESKPSLDSITVGLYLEKHPKLLEKYDEYGGFETIEKAKTYVKEDNLDGYVKELQKWNAVLGLVKRKFPIKDKISEFVDMSAEEIYEEYEAVLNHVFINVESEDKTYDITDGIYEFIEKLDEGELIGLPYYHSDMLTKEVNGHELGSITLIGGLSGMGKSSFVRNTTLPSLLEHKEKIIVMINEEGLSKWQRELLVWVVNTIFRQDLQKYTVRDGGFTVEVKALLIKAADWLVEHKGIITLIPFQRYTTGQAVKTIKKYCNMGVKYFVLDTFKADSDDGSISDNAWLGMQQGMVRLYDVIKPENKNLHLTVTFQLEKGASKQRYYTQSNIGMAKNIVDVASTCIMIRGLMDDEYMGGKRELKAYRLESKSKIPVQLKPGKHYQILFMVKNREGATNEYQIVVEHDLSRNTYREVGICNVPIDF